MIIFRIKITPLPFTLSTAQKAEVIMVLIHKAEAQKSYGIAECL